MNWQSSELKNPLSGKILRRDTAHSFSDGVQRFPVIEEIPFLRADRDELINQVLQQLDGGSERQALLLLLRDQDDWSPNAPPAINELEKLFDQENFTLRQAMQILNYGPVADYFAYRWSDPTYLSGLKLLADYFPSGSAKVFELACGIGHFLREFAENKIQATGADVVFSKLWLARRYLAPTAKLVCFDANFDFPFAGEQIFETAFCHDAFYFMPKKSHVAVELKRITCGAILIGHAHNADAENYSSGSAVPVAEYARLFENSFFYDDAELTAAFIENRAPQKSKTDELKKSEAISLASNAVANESEKRFSAAKRQENLRVNPLFYDQQNNLCDAPQYPSERYKNEYESLSGYLNLSHDEAAQLKSFPERVLNEQELENFRRRRILLDLPEKW